MRVIIILLNRFHDVDFEIIDRDGNRWVTLKQTAQAAEQPVRALRKLINELNKNGEMIRGRHFEYLPLQSSSGEQITMVLSHLGVMRVFMRSDAPRAREFRGWAETVLGPVMTQGYYLPAEAETALVQKLTGILEQRVDGRPTGKRETIHIRQ